MLFQRDDRTNIVTIIHRGPDAQQPTVEKTVVWTYETLHIGSVRWCSTNDRMVVGSLF